MFFVYSGGIGVKCVDIFYRFVFLNVIVYFVDDDMFNQVLYKIVIFFYFDRVDRLF